ncbi:MAG: hypothetical protein AB1502_19420 [Thermodesulfobacteriota bacterium]
MRIKVEPKKCSGCHLCEMVCSLFHLGMINTEKSAIRIEKDDLDTSLNTPILCHQCKEMKCLKGERVTESREKRKFVWNRIRAERCSFNALPVLDEHAYHCDLCGEDPQCIRVCTPRAISITK